MLKAGKEQEYLNLGRKEASTVISSIQDPPKVLNRQQSALGEGKLSSLAVDEMSKDVSSLKGQTHGLFEQNKLNSDKLVMLELKLERIDRRELGFDQRLKELTNHEAREEEQVKTQ